MATSSRVSHPTVDDRRARGLEARDKAPLSSHSGWQSSSDRPDPVGLLEEQDATREPDLVPVRHGRMLVSPFTFYRGAAKIMAADLSQTATSGLNVQLCGDAHIYRTSAPSPRRSGNYCSTSTTSTRPSRVLSSTTSSGWRPASPSPLTTMASPRRTRGRRRWRRWRPTGRRWPASAGWAHWRSGTPTSTRTSS
jgi:hypothetical protein